jgi:hypothetical protein
MTFAGCLYREESIPGRTPNVAEKVGVGEDFILADATTAGQSGSSDRPVAGAGQTSTPRAGQTDTQKPGQAGGATTGATGGATTGATAGATTGAGAGATAGLASGRMYKITKLDDQRLKALVGKRVEVMGTVKADDDARPGERSASNQNLPNIEATSIREVTGSSCPTQPAGAAPGTSSPSPNTNR